VGPVTLTFDGNWSDYALYNYPGELDTNIPVAPYVASVTGGGYDDPSVWMFCYDINSPTNIGTPYTGTVYPVSHFTGTTYTAMMEATYLVNMLDHLGGTGADLATRGAISLAIWELMDPSSTIPNPAVPPDPAAYTYLNEAKNAVNSGTWTAEEADHYPTWIPDNPSIQRFGGIVLSSDPAIPVPPPDPTPVPEPSTVVPLGLGMLGLLVFGRFAGGRH